MLDWILIGVALAVGGGEGGDAGGDAVAMADNAASALSAFVAEDQTPSGKFTTAAEVKPILTMTKGNWVALREYGGQDLLYVTHLMAWRCGLHELRYSVNGGAMQVWDTPPCLSDTAQPNAIRTEDGLPYTQFPLGAVQNIRVELLYDDMSTDSVEFMRKEVLMP